MSELDLSNKSKYVQSLVAYILDTKPYHSKLTEALEEFNFVDTANVAIEEKLTLRTKMSPAWTYNYFSSGNINIRTTPVHRIVHPAFLRGLFTTGIDENTDMASVPYVYSKKSFDGLGVADAGVVRTSTATFEPMVEGHDYFQSHGSFQFQVKQTVNSSNAYAPLWSETRDDGVITAAVNTTRTNALDLTIPWSALNKLRITMDEFLEDVGTGGNDDLKIAMAEIFAIAGVTNPAGAYPELISLIADATADRIANSLAIPYLPQTYEALINNLVSVQLVEPHPLLTPEENLVTTLNLDAIEDAQEYYSTAFEALTPGLFFGSYGDLGLRESGAIAYDDISVPAFDEFYLKVFNITPVLNTTNYEEWNITLVDDAIQQFRVVGTVSGPIGFFLAGESFISSRITFDTSIDPNANPQQEGVTGIYVPGVEGDSFTLVPRNKLNIHQDANLETWNIIHVNPISYSRPLFNSTRIGGIKDLNGNIGSISIVGAAANGDISLTRRDDGYFELVNKHDPTHQGIVAVDELYNDGLIAFTIIGGSEYVYQTGDVFFIKVVNEPAQVNDLDLGFGYDLDSYDMPDLVYERPYTTARRVGFSYDARLTDYDLNSLNLQITDDAVNGRSWRLRAIPDTTLPLVTVKRKPDDSFSAPYIDPPVGYPGAVDLSEGRDIGEVVSDGPVYRTLPQDPDELPPELELYEATKFALEWSDDGFVTINLVDANISVGGPAAYPAHGLSFTLTNPSKPFIGVKALHNGVVRTDLGGDVFSFTVVNPAPYLTDIPIGLTSAFVPRLKMCGDSFFKTEQADWTVLFTSPTTYTVSSALGTWNGSFPITGILASEGRSFKNEYVQFTIFGDRFIAGDYFTFSTFDEHPTYLVYGSVSGWQPPATVGQYYWNGQIGFKIELPEARTFQVVSGETVPVDGLVTVDYMRPDIPNCNYIFELGDTGFMVSRSDIGPIGFVEATGTFSDKHLTVTLNNPTEDFRLEILQMNELTTWNAQDTVILNPVNSARLPETGDGVFVEKTENGGFSININTTSSDISPLRPISIDQRFIDTNTNLGGVSLETTSPDATIYTGWLPLYYDAFDSSTSIAEFIDPATRYEIYSCGNGAKVGTIQPSTGDINTPIIFTWDQDFFSDYLPLDTEANIVIRGTGLDDKLRAHISESLKILIGAGPLLEDFMFSDEISVDFVEEQTMDIGMTYSNVFDVAAEDGPFAGFLSGYDTHLYEWEAGARGTAPTESDTTGGLYDAGQPPDIVSLLSKLNITAEETQHILDMWNFYLEDPETLPSTDEQWEYVFSMLAPYSGGIGDPSPGTSADNFGVPLKGLGLDVKAGPDTEASTSIEEAIVMYSENTEDSSDVIAYIYTNVLTPTDLSGSPTFATLQTPLVVDRAVKTIEILFSGTRPALLAMSTPSFSIWQSGDIAGTPIVATNISLGRYKITLASPAIVKISFQ